MSFLPPVTLVGPLIKALGKPQRRLGRMLWVGLLSITLAPRFVAPAGGYVNAILITSNRRGVMAIADPPAKIQPRIFGTTSTTGLARPNGRGRGICVYLFIFKKTGNFCLLLFVFIWNKIRHFCLTNCNYVLL